MIEEVQFRWLSKSVPAPERGKDMFKTELVLQTRTKRKAHDAEVNEEAT